MAKRKKAKKARRIASKPANEGIALERELVVIAKRDLGLRATMEGVASIAGANVSPLKELLASEEMALMPLFGVGEERLQAQASSLAAETGADVPDLSVYYRVEAPDKQLDKLAERLLQMDGIEAAYVKPPSEPAQLRLNDMTPQVEEPPVTPDFTARQGYLDAAPGGIDARYAWTHGGGGGAGVRIIDIEGAWRFSHEDLLQNQGGVVGGTQSTDIRWRNHGTAVVGEFGGDRNAFGITGICPDANVRAISIFGGTGSAGAIRQAANMLSPGDIILIELHRAGPRFNFTSRLDQRGYIAIEWWQDDFEAYRYAFNRGVIVVEAAGNGAENLDDAIYSTRPVGFPANWTNPFNRANRDSGAIVVGAGAPPAGTHGRNHGPDRSRLDFSNWGALIDAQGWGREVTTTGYGDLQGGSNEDEWYTDRFSGTSSASPIVVGALGCVQGVLNARGTTPLTPTQARALLRTTGSPQQDAQGRPATQRIGNRPNLRQMISTGVNTVPLYRYWNGRIGDHFYTTNWRELGTGKHGWRYEGIQCHVLPQRRRGSVPLYRYWNGRIGDHFYTTNWRELGSGRYGWRYEGIQCYVYPTRILRTIPLYRYWNGRIGDHFYTTNWGELGSGRYGWRYEGIQCYVFSQPASAPSAGSESTTLEEPLAPAIPPTFMVGSPAVPTVSDDPSIYEGSFLTSTIEEEHSPAPQGDSFTMVGDSVTGQGEYEGSFVTSATEEEHSLVPQGDSFTMVGDSVTGQGKAGRSSGQVTVNVNVSPCAGDETEVPS